VRRLFNTVFRDRRNHLILFFIVVSMGLLTVASQLEILALGIVTKKGPDFFELFAPEKEGRLQRSNQVSFDETASRWPEISSSAVITKKDAEAFLTKRKSSDRVQQAINFINQYISISGNVWNLAWVLVFVAFLKAVSLFLNRFLTKVMAIRVSRDLRQDFFEHIQSLPMRFYQRYNMGMLSSRVVSDAAMISEAIGGCLSNYIRTPLMLGSTLILCFITSWQLSSVVFLGFPAIVLPIVFIAKKVRSLSRQIQQNQERFTSTLLDFLGGILTVKVFGMEEFSLKKYGEHNHKIASLEKKSAKYDLSSRPVVHTIAMAFLSMSMLWGLYVLKLSIAEVFFFCGLLYLFYEPVKKFAEENSRIQRGVAAADRLFEILAERPEIVDGTVIFDDFKDALVFDAVSFRYDARDVLLDLSFTVKRGETVALVGPTGSGKSTIVQLIPRLYDVQKGEIRLDGNPLSAYTQSSLRENVAFVPQKPFLFIDTVAANIAFGRDYTRADVTLAAKRAHADEFIQNLEDGYDTLLSEGGKNLSGGQQQRLAIARALVKDAPILILDEATSSLDAISERHIQEAICELRGKITQIIIAHRLSTVRDADKIIYLDKGRKIAEGTLEELLKICPEFRLMWETMHRENQK